MSLENVKYVSFITSNQVCVSWNKMCKNLHLFYITIWLKLYFKQCHQICVTDMATRYSQKCCEELVAAGAIDTILELIRSVTRSIPDQEVLRHSLSTLRNLARYPHLTEVLINSRGSVQTILWEFLRFVKEHTPKYVYLYNFYLFIIFLLSSY